MGESSNAERRTITVGISGGSGAAYAVRLLHVIAAHYDRVDVVISTHARQVIHEELALRPPQTGAWMLPGLDSAVGERVVVWSNQDYRAPFASGSNCPRQMVIVPCSMSTVASIAHGIDQSVMHHAAGVMLKERRQLIVVPRETPLSAVHLRNLLTLSELGVSVVAAMPGFYGGQRTFDDLIDFVVQKIVNQLDLDLRVAPRWGEPNRNAADANEPSDTDDTHA